jgi:hypothetical protein
MEQPGRPSHRDLDSRQRRRLANRPQTLSPRSPHDRAIVNDRKAEEIVWTPPARPFFERQRECPQGALRTRPLSDYDEALAWWVA